MQTNKSVITLGAFEPVSFPEFGIQDITAKIDTGAYTGALHCTRISEKETPTGKVLEFSPFDHPEATVTEEDFLVSHVKSSNGYTQNRYFIKTDILLRGKKYPIVLTLADRSEMKWPMLIGRRFLSRHNFIVDVRSKKVVW